MLCMRTKRSISIPWRRRISSVFLGLLLTALSLGPAGVPAHTSSGDRFESLTVHYATERRAAVEALRRAKTAEERKKARAMFPSLEKYAPRFLALAEGEPDDPAAIDALLWVVEAGLLTHDSQKGVASLVGSAMDGVLRGHLGDDKVGRVCLCLVHYPSPLRDRFLRAVYERTPDRAVRGRACLALAQYLENKALFVQHRLDEPATEEEKLSFAELYGGRDYVEHLRDCNPQALHDEAERLFHEVIARYGDISYICGVREINGGKPLPQDLEHRRNLAEVAESDLGGFLGRRARDISGKDIDGRRFKLSDYRGKVVVLTFSGNWCGPCRAMYPHERELVRRLKDRPFALLSVNTDRDGETLRRSIESGEITWRCWHDGGADGPITSDWQIKGFPDVYVIDPRGMIRYRGLRDRQLDAAVDTLLKALEPVSKPRKE
jgi:thiol-disulfide isomerase/thioredoxin